MYGVVVAEVEGKTRRFPKKKERLTVVLITVFTPTYNRAYCLGQCYESLKRQTSKNFEWLIVDDGSTDHTKELVAQWIANTPEFKIRYVFKENGGMHTGYNTAYEHISTELCMNVDSDDYLVDTAIERIADFWGKNKRQDVGGIYALDCDKQGNVIGKPFPEDLREFRGWGFKTVFYEADGKKKKYVNAGDKKFIGVTSIIKQYPPIPVFPGEKYHSLYYKQHLIERDYMVLILNEPVCVVEYLADGSSKNMLSQYYKNPKGFCSERRFTMKYAPEFSMRLKEAIHYVAESLLAKDKHLVKHSTNKPATIMAFPAGVLLYLYIVMENKR